MSQIGVNFKLDLTGFVLFLLSAVGPSGVIQFMQGKCLLWISLVLFFMTFFYLLLSNSKRKSRENKIPEILSEKTRIPILIIDDDPNHLHLMKGAFEGMEYDIAVSRSLDDVRFMESFAIIVSDIRDVSLTNSTANNHSEEILKKIETEHPYKKIIRVSLLSQTGIIKKHYGYEYKVKEKVDQIIEQMKNPQKYWNAISSQLESDGAGATCIQETRKKFILFLRTKLEQ